MPEQSVVKSIRPTDSDLRNGKGGARSTRPSGSIRREGDRMVMVLIGNWDLESSPPHFESLIDTGRNTATTLAFDISELDSWDSSLLVLVLKAHAYCEANGIKLDTSALPERVSRLLALAVAVPERATAKKASKLSGAELLGRGALSAWEAASGALTFTGEFAIAFVGLLRRSVRMRWREFWVVVESNSTGALPIVTLIALLVGVIIAFLGVVVLERFGAGYYSSYLVGFGMLRELGALMTGIIMAGRTGAGFAAEIGSMKITEEIDAYTTLGISPIEHLVMPRVLGLVLMMPLLTVYADFVGILGGLSVAVTLLDLSAQQFIGGLLSAVTLTDALLGVFKGFLFGVIIGLAGCMKGLQTGSDAGAVGRAATSAVVVGITLIILANAIIDWLAALLKL